MSELTKFMAGLVLIVGFVASGVLLAAWSWNELVVSYFGLFAKPLSWQQVLPLTLLGSFVWIVRRATRENAPSAASPGVPLTEEQVALVAASVIGQQLSPNGIRLGVTAKEIN